MSDVSDAEVEAFFKVVNARISYLGPTDRQACWDALEAAALVSRNAGFLPVLLGNAIEGGGGQRCG